MIAYYIQKSGSGKCFFQHVIGTPDGAWVAAVKGFAGINEQTERLYADQILRKAERHEF